MLYSDDDARGRDEYKHHLLMTRSKYLPMTKEDVTKLTPEDQNEYQNTFKLKRQDIRLEVGLINLVNIL